MHAFALFAFLCGAVLAFRFKVVVLYPVMGLSGIVAVVLGLAAGIALGAILIGIIVCAVAIQIGYLFGALVRGTLIAARLAVRRRQLEVSRRPAQTA